MKADPDEQATRAVRAPDDPPARPGRTIVFTDRHDAGRRLAVLLEPLRSERPVVFAIPRGGVPVGAEVARALSAPLEALAVRKVGAPQNPEFALGAVAEGGVHVLSREAVRRLGLPQHVLRTLLERCERELEAQVCRYHATAPTTSPQGRTAILVDDGLATGRTALAAVRSLRARGAVKVVLAVPVAAPEAAATLTGEADAVYVVETPPDLWAVGSWYQDFSPPSEAEVGRELAAAGSRGPDDAGGEVTIAPAGGPALAGELLIPEAAAAIVVFAHGSGSSRRSRRNRAVAARLRRAGFATLLMDLLTPAEERARANVFDIPLLARRLAGAAAWVRGREHAARLPLAYFGASTGAAAALTAAARDPGVAAVVSRGGRPDLAIGLADVRAPTLLIVGGADTAVLELNRLARGELRCESELAVIPGATHLFEEPGALERAGELAARWLTRHAGASAPRRPPS